MVKQRKMISRLNEDELDIYLQAEKQIASLLEDFITEKGYDIVWDIVAEHNYKSETGMEPGSSGVDASVDRIVHNLKTTFTNT
jgi:hypothetical protein